MLDNGRADIVKRRNGGGSLEILKYRNKESCTLLGSHLSSYSDNSVFTRTNVVFSKLHLDLRVANIE